MKAILYFINSGIPTTDEQKKATKLSESSGEKVVFRNGRAAPDSIEDCIGVAGAYPPAYADKVYGQVKKKRTRGNSKGDAEGVEVNKLGLPVGAPDTLKALKEYFVEHDVKFHKGANQAALVKLYKDSFCGGKG